MVTMLRLAALVAACLLMATASSAIGGVNICPFGLQDTTWFEQATPPPCEGLTVSVNKFNRNPKFKILNNFVEKDFTISMLFSLDSTHANSKHKIIDFSDLKSDAGLYIRDAKLYFDGYGGKEGTTEMDDNQYVQVTLTRTTDADGGVAENGLPKGTVSVYLDRKLELTFKDDSALAAVPFQQYMYLWTDDADSQSMESSPGRFVTVRVWDTALEADFMRQLYLCGGIRPVPFPHDKNMEAVIEIPGEDTLSGIDIRTFGKDGDERYPKYTDENGRIMYLNRFDKGQGIELTNMFTGDVFTLAIMAMVDSVGGYVKLVDFKNRQTDNGLYIKDGKTMFKGPEDSNKSSRTDFEAKKMFQVVITRSTKKVVTVYVNGFKQIAFQDETDLAVAEMGSMYSLFIDDLTTQGQESSGGAVLAVRLFDEFLNSDSVKALNLGAQATLSVLPIFAEKVKEENKPVAVAPVPDEPQIAPMNETRNDTSLATKGPLGKRDAEVANADCIKECFVGAQAGNDTNTTADIKDCVAKCVAPKEEPADEVSTGREAELANKECVKGCLAETGRGSMTSDAVATMKACVSKCVNTGVKKGNDTDDRAAEKEEAVEDDSKDDKDDTENANASRGHGAEMEHSKCVAKCLTDYDAAKDDEKKDMVGGVSKCVAECLQKPNDQNLNPKNGTGADTDDNGVDAGATGGHEVQMQHVKCVKECLVNAKRGENGKAAACVTQCINAPDEKLEPADDDEKDDTGDQNDPEAVDPAVDPVNPDAKNNGTDATAEVADELAKTDNSTETVDNSTETVDNSTETVDNSTAAAGASGNGTIADEKADDGDAAVGGGNAANATIAAEAQKNATDANNNATIVKVEDDAIKDASKDGNNDADANDNNDDGSTEKNAQVDALESTQGDEPVNKEGDAKVKAEDAADEAKKEADKKSDQEKKEALAKAEQAEKDKKADQLEKKEEEDKKKEELKKNDDAIKKIEEVAKKDEAEEKVEAKKNEKDAKEKSDEAKKKEIDKKAAEQVKELEAAAQGEDEKRKDLKVAQATDPIKKDEDEELKPLPAKPGKGPHSAAGKMVPEDGPVYKDTKPHIQFGCHGNDPETYCPSSIVLGDKKTRSTTEAYQKIAAKLEATVHVDVYVKVADFADYGGIVGMARGDRDRDVKGWQLAYNKNGAFMFGINTVKSDRLMWFETQKTFATNVWYRVSAMYTAGDGKPLIGIAVNGQFQKIILGTTPLECADSGGKTNLCFLCPPKGKDDDACLQGDGIDYDDEMSHQDQRVSLMTYFGDIGKNRDQVGSIGPVTIANELQSPPAPHIDAASKGVIIALKMDDDSEDDNLASAPRYAVLSDMKDLVVGMAEGGLPKKLGPEPPALDVTLKNPTADSITKWRSDGKMKPLRLKYNGSIKEAYANLRDLAVKKTVTILARIRPLKVHGRDIIFGALTRQHSWKEGFVLGYTKKRFFFGLASKNGIDVKNELHQFTRLYASGPDLTDENNNIEDKKWYHVAATYDGMQMKLYVDGVLQATSEMQRGEINFGGKRPKDLRYAFLRANVWYDWVTQKPLDADVGYITVYNKAMDAEDIEEVAGKVNRKVNVGNVEPPADDDNNTPTEDSIDSPRDNPDDSDPVLPPVATNSTKGAAAQAGLGADAVEDDGGKLELVSLAEREDDLPCTEDPTCVVSIGPGDSVVFGKAMLGVKKKEVFKQEKEKDVETLAGLDVKPFGSSSCNKHKFKAVPRPFGVAGNVMAIRVLKQEGFAVRNTFFKEEYTLAMAISADAAAERYKLIDFQGLTSDTGVYYEKNRIVVDVGDGKKLQARSGVEANVPTAIVLTRDDKAHVKIYVDGELQLEFDDENSVLLPMGDEGYGGTFWFLRDDSTTNGKESVAGWIMGIRVYHNVLSATQVQNMNLMLFDNPNPLPMLPDDQRDENVDLLYHLTDLCGVQFARFGKFTEDGLFSSLKLAGGGSVTMSRDLRNIGSEMRNTFVKDGYTITMLFKLDSVDGLNKILDFKALQTPDGLYIRDGRVAFKARNAIKVGEEVVATKNKVLQVTITRNPDVPDAEAKDKRVPGKVSVYANGKKQFGFNDPDGVALPGADTPFNGYFYFFSDYISAKNPNASPGWEGRVRVIDRALAEEDVRVLNLMTEKDPNLLKPDE